MVASQDGDVAKLFCVLVPIQVLVKETGYTAAGIFLEVTVILRVPVAVNTAAVVVIVAHQCGVAAALFVENEIHVITAAQGQGRIAPFRNHRGVRELEVKHAAHIFPDRAGAGLLLIVVFDKGGGHIYAEAVAAVGEPEAHNVLKGLAGRDSRRIAETLLPGFCHLIEAVVEGGLAFEEVQNIASASLALAADVRKAAGAVEAEIRPDEAVGVFVFLHLLTFDKPGVLLGSVAGDQVQKNPDTLLMGLVKETVKVFIGAVAGCHLLVIADIVTCVFKRGVVAGIDPESVAAKALNIIQLFDDPVKISDAVRVCILERLGIDLIENCVL